jgi:hypothetical protein
MADAVQGILRNGNTTYQGSVQLNEKAEQLVAHGLPRYTEMTRKGAAWGCMSTAAVAGLVVRPSTTAALELFNGYPTGGKSLIVDRLFYFNLVSTNVIEGFSGWAMVTTSKAAPSSASLAVSSLQGNKAYSGPVVNAVSTTVVANGWFPWTNAYQKGAGGVVPFGATIGEVDGRLIVPPQCSLCLHVVSSLVGQTFTQGASWYEEQITLE